MPTGGKSRVRKTRGWFSRDNRRALGICLCFGAIVVISLGAVFPHAPTAIWRGVFAGSATIKAEDDLSTGTIVIVPILGNVCRKRLIDNATWRIRDIGFVSCRTALNPRVQESGWSGSRVDIIRHGFNRR
jgi:hypothetical protein